MMFGQALADFQLMQTKLAQMATGIDAAALLTYRAAWLRDSGSKVTKEAAMAKMTATDMVQQVIDVALQMSGGQGVVNGTIVERRYRGIHALRIYEGAIQVQQLIGRHCPAMSAVAVAGLRKARARVEIEITAVVCAGSTGRR
jgi:acyl-CoA dehydrogenase